MKSKKGLIAIIASIVMVVVIAAVAIGAYAYGQQNVNSNISVTYNAIQVKGTVSATYQVKNGTATNMETDDEETTITFDGTEATKGPSTLAPDGDITLTAANNEVEFIYSFTNSGDEAYTATVVLPTTQTNVTVTVKTSADGTYAAFSDTGTKNNSVTVAAKSGETDGTAVYYIKVAITDTNQDAAFSGTFGWVLLAAGFTQEA